MSVIGHAADVERLHPASPEALAFAARVRAMNIRLAEDYRASCGQ
jgi:hypothetical protein